MQRLPVTASSRGRFELERHIEDLARLYGWHHHHSRDASTRESYPDGFPRETLVNGERVVFLAVAEGASALTPCERAWVEALGNVLSVEVHVIGRTGLRQVTHLLRLRKESA
jgi:hypothetical protein